MNQREYERRRNALEVKNLVKDLELEFWRTLSDTFYDITKDVKTMNRDEIIEYLDIIKTNIDQEKLVVEANYI